MISPLRVGILACLLTLTCLAPDRLLSDESLGAEALDPNFSLQGEYVSPEGAPERSALQVVALGDGLFRVVTYGGGLPGAGWNGKPPQVQDEEDGEIVQEVIDARQLQKVERASPTLGATPPAESVVLFDGTKETFNARWKSGAVMTDDGLLAQGAVTADSFDDFSLHLEFRIPFMPDARGQARGNSGVYAQGRYEAQVLDSFGLEGLNNECGGIYEVRDPDLNMCFPPMSWQTYDIDFTAPRWDGDGKKLSSARMTVRLNGVVVQRDVEIPAPTRAAMVAETPAPGPLVIQNHGNPVRFRNIWILPRNADQEARRPRIPGYERFHAFSEDPVEGGLLLVGELGCTNCHAPSETTAAILSPKQAPILTAVGQRLNVDWMERFLKRPHELKPGTTMPDLMSDWSEPERNKAVAALVSFLSSTGEPTSRPLDRQAIQRGDRLFHTVGCTACHIPYRENSVPETTSIPLNRVHEKYTLNGLSLFLQNPHAVRPSGRMPGVVTGRDADDIANYLMGGAGRPLPPNLNYALYDLAGVDERNLDALTPRSTGVVAGFDMTPARGLGEFAIRFEGALLLIQKEDYAFSLRSNGNAVLSIDGEPILKVGAGVNREKKTIRLDAGVHQVRVEFVHQSGFPNVHAEMGIPPWIPPQDLSALMSFEADGRPISVPPLPIETDEQAPFNVQPTLVSQGRALFQSLGCANCHAMEDSAGLVAPALSARPFANLATQEGCLSAQPESLPAKPIPDYDLAPNQRQQIAQFLNAAATLSAPSPHQQIERAMVTFNCYACHERGGRGGPEKARNFLFLTNEVEMGDEGRLPPPLNGTGDKLQDEWLASVLANGSHERHYMLTRMPNFGEKNVGHLASAFITLDRQPETPMPEFHEPMHRIKGLGRELAGTGGLACVKCHSFGAQRSPGIQAISLTSMTRRLRDDWFRRYLLDPARYRPGTRMPTGFPQGKSVVPDILNGDPARQTAAIWQFLTDGDNAAIPEGMTTQAIELLPVDRPIIYRNFIEGVSPRGIAVGFPEKAHLAWDANELCLKLIWHNRFIDASKHWVGRGDGKQIPLGDHLLVLEPTLAFATLDSRDAPWPTRSPREREGFNFRGYRLNAQGQPTFFYDAPFGAVSDFPQPIAKSDQEGTFRRTLTIHNAPERQLYFRAAVGDVIEQTNDGYRVDDALTIRVAGGETPFIRTSGSVRELLVPVVPVNGDAELVQEILW